MASLVEQPWRRPVVSGPSPSSPKNVHCLSGGAENLDNKRQNLGKPPSPPRSSSPTCPPAKDVDSDSSDGSIPNTPPRPTSSSTTRSNVCSDITKGRKGSLSSSLPSAVPPAVGDAAVHRTQVRQYHVVERDWNDIHDTTHGLLPTIPSPQNAGGSRENGAGDNTTRITLPSLDIPRYRTHSGTQHLVNNTRSPDSTPSTRSSSNSIADSTRRASFASERTGWSSSPPILMPPPPLPPQSYTAQLDTYARVAEKASGVPRANPLSVSELIHREAIGTHPQPTPRTSTPAATGDRLPSLMNEFVEVLNIYERVSDVDMSKFLEELNYQLSLTGLLREAREHICSSFELGDRQRSTFTTYTRAMLRAEIEPVRGMREVVARAVVGMSQREMGRFEEEVGHMIDNSQYHPTSPYREAICCAAYAARFPEDQLEELRRQLRRTPLAAFQANRQRQQQQQQQQQQHQPHSNSSAAGTIGQQQHTSIHNLPPPRECEKIVEPRRPGAGGATGRKDPPRPVNYSLREFPILSSG
ncbi:hypothetical protein KVR01_008320 [Diaporthe batatas]|uniref:uncharacterized protein n=1 Tax=Diaporthe batatas TaxID=748121 RepID=UPI001D03834F|nr:uncharacterized protein KVR01_008320 [Diaporthe batatas]KAG8162555.1 hypothetical protein KVR01_008320 [Diaporthe batatas]